MGGVDLHDNGFCNYRINVRGKKWWWPLFVNLIDSTIVNAWKIFRLANNSKMSQLDFKSYIALRLIKATDGQINVNVSHPVVISVPDEVRLDNVGHVIIKEKNKARSRCKLCNSHTIYICAKCNVHLHTDCFEGYGR